MKKIILILIFFPTLITYGSVKDFKFSDLYFYYGGGIGVSSLETRFENEILEETDRVGYRISLDFAPSYYTDNWVFDLGPGWLHTKFEDKKSNGTLIKLKTSTFFVEGAARYRISPEWSFGLFYINIVGQKLILGASQNISNADTDETASQLAGLALFKDVYKDKDRTRYYAKLERSLDVEKRELTTLNLGVQWAIGRVPPTKSSEIKMKMELTKNFINFETNKDQLDERSIRILKEIAIFLNSNLGDWRNIRISGHTDSIGNDKYNKDLSQRRANSVRQAFINSGTRVDRVRAIGHGEELPVASNSTSSGRFKNRRVEIEFLGRTNVNKIQTFLNELLKREGKSPIKESFRQGL